MEFEEQFLEKSISELCKNYDIIKGWNVNLCRASADFIDGLKQSLKGCNKSYIYSLANGKEEISIPSSGPEAYEIVQTYIDSYIKNHPYPHYIY